MKRSKIKMSYTESTSYHIFEKSLCFLFIQLLLLFPLLSNVESENYETKMDTLIQPLVRKGLLGGVILIAENGKKCFEKGYGYSDREKKVPNTRDTRFRISSITKVFTALAIMQLYERGQLDINKPVKHYFADLDRGDEITIYHLLTHTSGIPSYNWLKSNNKPRPLATVYKWIIKLPLRFKPGTGFLYSNSGYTLLAIIIEKVSSRPYEEYLKRHIFSPLGMADTGLTWMNKPIKNLGYGYTKSGYADYQRSNRPTPLGRGDGDLYSTASDLLKLANAFYSDKIVSEKIRKIMTTPHKGRIGLGWYISQKDGISLVYHPGGSLGYISNLRIYQKGKKVLINLFNSDFLLFRQVDRQLEAITLGKPFSPIFSYKKKGKYLDQLKPFFGEYFIDNTQKFSISQKNGNLVFQETGFPECPAYIYEENRIYVIKNNYDITFIKDESGFRFEGLFGLFQVKGPKISMHKHNGVIH